MTMEVNFPNAVANIDSNKTSKQEKNVKDKNNVPVGENNSTPANRTDTIKNTIAQRDYTPEQKLELNNLLDDAVRRAGKDADLDSLPSPRKVEGDLSYKEILKDFKDRLDTWVADQKFKPVEAEENRKAGNTQTAVMNKLMKEFPKADKGFVNSLIAQKMDENPDATLKEIYDYVAEYLDF